MTAPTITVGPEPVDAARKPDDIVCWSVTTIIGCLDKPALTYWAAEQTAAAAVDDVDVWQAIHTRRGRDEAVRWLTGARFRHEEGSRTAADLGTAVHEACERYVIDGVRPDVDDEVGPFLDQFDRWLQRAQPEYQAAEVTVYSPTFGYAGTCDGFLTVGGVRSIFDYKTSRRAVDKKGNPTGPYPEVALQLAAYRHAEIAAVWRPRRFEQFRRRYYALSPEEMALAVPVPEVDTGLVIHITDQHCDAYPVRCDAEVHRAFLYVLEAARWQFQMSRDAIGERLELP